MAQAKHKYRVSVYLGKELYLALEEMAETLGLSVATITKIMLDNGYQFAKEIERSVINGKQ